jgi:mycofactocin system creatininase family protein
VGLHDLTWPEVPPEAVVVIPVGSFEQHGPHLPLDTDTVIAAALAESLDRPDGSVQIAPPIAYGASGEHAGFPGTLSVGTSVLTSIAVELIRSADHFGGVVLVNGHGGNLEALRDASSLADREGRRVLIWSPRLPGGDAHAGHTETSLMLHLQPGRVRMDRAVKGETRPLDELMTDLRSGGVAAVEASGVLGDATTATAETGRELFEALVADLAGAFERWAAGRPR